MIVCTPIRVDVLVVGDVIFPGKKILSIERVGSKRRIWTGVSTLGDPDENALFHPAMMVIREVELGS